MARLRRPETEIQDQGAGVIAAGVGVAATRGGEAEAELTIDTTDEAGVAASREGEAIAATGMIEAQVTAVSCQTGGEVHHRGQGRAREVEQMLSKTQRNSLLRPRVRNMPRHCLP